MKNPEVDSTGKQIGWLYCTPEEWEELSDWKECPKDGNHMILVKGWDSDCNDYSYLRCPMCGLTEGEE